MTNRSTSTDHDTGDHAPEMDCSTFLAHFTDYRDGSAPDGVAEAMDAHADGCETCRRYRTVVDRGAMLLRSLPEPELRPDFEPRLRHRIYSLDADRVLASHQSGTPALTVLGIAVLLAILAWAPLLLVDGRDVRLEPIVVDRAPGPAVRPNPLSPPGTFSSSRPGQLVEGLWEDALLYEYSELWQRYPRRPLLRRVSGSAR